jgi:hypothetical protein
VSAGDGGAVAAASLSSVNVNGCGFRGNAAADEVLCAGGAWAQSGVASLALARSNFTNNRGEGHRVHSVYLQPGPHSRCQNPRCGISEMRILSMAAK